MPRRLRGDRPSDNAIKQPDSVGRWSFIGTIKMPSEKELVTGVSLYIPSIEPQPFDVRQGGDRFLIAEVGEAVTYPADWEWIGWWVKQEG